jgi:hypothetical protein
VIKAWSSRFRLKSTPIRAWSEIEWISMRHIPKWKPWTSLRRRSKDEAPLGPQVAALYPSAIFFSHKGGRDGHRSGLPSPVHVGARVLYGNGVGQQPLEIGLHHWPWPAASRAECRGQGQRSSRTANPNHLTKFPPPGDSQIVQLLRSRKEGLFLERRGAGVAAPLSNP